MKSRFLNHSLPRSAVALAALLLGGAAVAQPAAPAPMAAPDARPPAAGPAAPRRPPPPADSGTAATVTGRVVRWLPNPNGEVDGMLLEDGTQVAFPPHLSATLIGAVTLRDTVQVTGRTGQTAKLIRATQLRDTTSGKSVGDSDATPGTPPAPRAPAALAPMTANGRIVTLLHTDRGDVNGVLLDSGTVVRFPPHVGNQLGTTLQSNGTLFAQGYGTASAQGSALEATRIGASADAAQAVFHGPRGPAGEPPRPEAGGMPPAPPAPGASPSVPASAPR